MEILNFAQIEKLNDKSLFEYSQLVGANARKWKNHFVALLPEISRRGIYKKKFSSISEFAAKVGGVEKKTVEAVFQVDKKLKDKPELLALIPEVGVNKVRVVAAIATKENQKELAIKVKTMSKSALEVVAKSVREDKTLSPQMLGLAPGRSYEKEYFGCYLSKENALELRKFKQKLENEKKQKVDFNEVLGELLLKVSEKHGEKPKRDENVSQRMVTGKQKGIAKTVRADRKRKVVTKSVSRHVPVKKRREVELVYKGCCAFPGCNKPSGLLHHPDRFVLNQSHERVVPLCPVHHELAHHGLVGNEEEATTKWFIRKNCDKNLEKSSSKNLKYRIDMKVVQHKLVFRH